MSRILVVDDKEMMRDSVTTTLARKGHATSAAPDARSALEKIAQRTFDAIITDLQMPEMDGVELLAAIRRLDEHVPVILMTAYGTIETAVQAMKGGAYDYITKPFSGDELLVTVERAIEHSRLLRENQILRAGATVEGSAASRAHQLIGDSPAINGVIDRMARIAESHGTVLITGESGAGKEVAARWIHEHSPRKNAPFLALNCAALSTSLLESELFGHEKGAYTGADKLRKGRFELADGGTLLLDEISEIAPEIQAKLLRVLQERAFERVGSSASRAVDVRVIATTNRDLTGEARRGTFREDLYFRLNVLPVHMPPLRRHAEDIPTLVEFFLNETARREGKPVKAIEPEGLQLMVRYDWPGNVRELQNVCERASVLSTEGVIRAELIAPWLNAAPAPGHNCDADQEFPTTAVKAGAMIEVRDADVASNGIPRIVCDGHKTLEDVERETIIATLTSFNGHRQKSARALGIGVRTLGLKLKKWKELQLVSPNL
jgi:DNA-binding NtrC family response regulator